jgi:hypothetical protein
MVTERSTDSLPSHPRVVVDDGVIVVINENGERIVWDYEDDRATAEDIATEIEVGLQAISYVRSHLLDFLNLLTDQLLDFDVPIEMIERAIDDAYCDIYRRLPQITKQLRSRAEKR